LSTVTMPEIETIEPEAPDPVIEILARAIDVLIERGWCQGHGADERGGPIGQMGTSDTIFLGWNRRTAARTGC